MTPKPSSTNETLDLLWFEEQIKACYLIIIDSATSFLAEDAAFTRKLHKISKV